MAHLIVNEHSTFHLNSEEEESGQIFSDLQLMVLRNKRTGIMAEKSRITLDPYKPLEFTQQEAYLRGQMDILTWIVDTSEEVTEAIKARLAQQQ